VRSTTIVQVSGHTQISWCSACLGYRVARSRAMHRVPWIGLVLVFDLVRPSAPVPWLSGRASASHAEGRWFDPSRDHPIKTRSRPMFAPVSVSGLGIADSRRAKPPRMPAPTQVRRAAGARTARHAVVLSWEHGAMATTAENINTHAYRPATGSTCRPTTTRRSLASDRRTNSPPSNESLEDQPRFRHPTPHAGNRLLPAPARRSACVSSELKYVDTLKSLWLSRVAQG
jgi:hypothetical protein